MSAGSVVGDGDGDEAHARGGRDRGLGLDADAGAAADAAVDVDVDAWGESARDWVAGGEADGGQIAEEGERALVLLSFSSGEGTALAAAIVAVTAAAVDDAASRGDIARLPPLSRLCGGIVAAAATSAS